jgi:hypothetical protein
VNIFFYLEDLVVTTQAANKDLLEVCFLLTTCLAYSSILNTEAALSFETAVDWTAQRHFSVSSYSYLDYTASNIFKQLCISQIVYVPVHIKR